MNHTVWLIKNARNFKQRVIIPGTIIYFHNQNPLFSDSQFSLHKNWRNCISDENLKFHKWEKNNTFFILSRKVISLSRASKSGPLCLKMLRCESLPTHSSNDSLDDKWDSFQMTRADFFSRSRLESRGIKIHLTFKVGEFKWNSYHCNITLGVTVRLPKLQYFVKKDSFMTKILPLPNLATKNSVVMFVNH